MNEIVSLTHVTKLFQHEESLIVYWSLVMSILFYIIFTIKENTFELHLLSSKVRNYTTEFIHKLDAKNRTEAASIAANKGWL